LLRRRFCQPGQADSQRAGRRANPPFPTYTARKIVGTPAPNLRSLMKDRKFINASEVGQFVLCRRSWFLQSLKTPSLLDAERAPS
jgi:hypothetical protein